jgi:hypothetical protein
VILERLQTLKLKVSAPACGAAGPDGPPPPGPPPPGAGLGLNCACAAGSNPKPNAHAAIASADFQPLMGDTPFGFFAMPRARTMVRFSGGDKGVIGGRPITATSLRVI